MPRILALLLLVSVVLSGCATPAAPTQTTQVAVNATSTEPSALATEIVHTVEVSVATEQPTPTPPRKPDTTATPTPTLDPLLALITEPLTVTSAAPVATIPVTATLAASANPLPQTGATATETAAKLPSDLKMVSFVAWWHDTLGKRSSLENLDKSVELGINGIVLVPTQYQETLSSTEIFSTSNTSSDEDLIAVAQEASKRGLSVVISPHLNTKTGEWSARIEPEDFDVWFANYSAMILHYADMAESVGAVGFSIGNELGGVTGVDASWVELAGKVRERFPSGWIFYSSTNEESTEITWWSAVDVIGVNFYPVLAEGPTMPTEEEATVVLAKKVAPLKELSEKEGRPIFFSEIGFKSVEGALQDPARYDVKGAAAPEEQAFGYRVVLNLLMPLYDQPWLAGIAWWFVDPRPERTGPEDADYTPLDKPAGDYLKSVWGK